jgi:hypothetical protein
VAPVSIRTGLGGRRYSTCGPHTVLLAAEAMHAAGAQSRTAGEELDLALRRAFWTQSRSISHRQVIPPLSDFPTIISSVRRLLALPDETRIHPATAPTPPWQPSAPPARLDQPRLVRPARVSGSRLAPGASTKAAPSSDNRSTA